MSRSLWSAPYNVTMSLGLRAMESNWLPDALVRQGIRALLKMRVTGSHKPTLEEQLRDLMLFKESLKEMPIAVNTMEANEQHYEVPTEFFKLCLGKHLKYSSCYFPKPNSSLDDAEAAMLNLYCDRARLADGQKVLELGCGWGSLSLFMAAKYPNSQITGLSNSAVQRAHIEEEARRRGLTNLKIVTCDINNFSTEESFDRVVTVEMFEHMKNYQILLAKIALWMKPDALLFVHIFTHKEFAYHFEDTGEDDWMARNFFTGGTMPADNLLLYFQDDLSIVDHWRMSGKHYAATSEAWLKNMDKHIAKIRPIFAETYGKDQVTKWVVRWRVFYMAVAELFAWNNGEEWLVSHYLFRKRPLQSSVH